MNLSIVIPTFNRADLFARTLPALAGQQTDGFGYEVIFVANGSTDATDSILKDAVARYPELFRYYWIEPTGGPSAPRNVGIRAAKGEIVIILDDDVAPNSDLVLRHVEFHRSHPGQHEACIGQTYVPADLREDPMSVFHSHYSYDRFNGVPRLSYFDFWTCNVSFKRQFMLEHGMFDESIKLLEDIEVAYRMERAGMHLHYLPAANGEHLHQSSDPASMTARSYALGSWLYRVHDRVPGIRKRFGFVSTELGLEWFVKRLVRLAGFLMVDNPLTRGVLLLCGARSSKRSRVTDAYYALVFHRAFQKGYYLTWFRAWRASGSFFRRQSAPAGRPV